MVATNADVQLQQMFDDLYLEIHVDQLDTSKLNREKQKKVPLGATSHQLIYRRVLSHEALFTFLFC